MFIRDALVVLGFLVFLWVTMCFMIFAICIAVGSSPAKNVIIAVGVLALLFATLSLVALICHLYKHKQTIYAEEMLHAEN